jgi:predicted nucleic acid-binding Zn finger protein
MSDEIRRELELTLDLIAESVGEKPKPEAQIFRIKSSSKEDMYYTVVKNNSGEWTCVCPDFMYSKRGKGHECKHIKEAKEVE